MNSMTENQAYDWPYDRTYVSIFRKAKLPHYAAAKLKVISVVINQCYFRHFCPIITSDNGSAVS